MKKQNLKRFSNTHFYPETLDSFSKLGYFPHLGKWYGVELKRQTAWVPSILCCFLTVWSVSLSAELRYTLPHMCVLRITWRSLGRASQCLPVRIKAGAYWRLTMHPTWPKGPWALTTTLWGQLVITPSLLRRHNRATFLWRILNCLINNENLTNIIFITVFEKYLISQQSLMAFKPLPGYLSFATAVWEEGSYFLQTICLGTQPIPSWSTASQLVRTMLKTKVKVSYPTWTVGIGMG